MPALPCSGFFAERGAAGAGVGAWVGCTPSFSSRSCCSVDSCTQVPGFFCRWSHLPMSLPSKTTPGSMVGRTPRASVSAMSASTR
ncbi:hypothetical protein [Streptomyces zaomyceticus]|uniref:hypothetical protein n=1 Tax=Streptomyces zaomyceticus TaxID=68286 RepID=UPI00386CCE04